jgi:hypothetical protein
MSLLKTVDNFIDFWIANYQLRMPLAMQLSFDLLELQISPENVWQVLRRVVYNVELSDVCDKVKLLSALNPSLNTNFIFRF